MPWFHHFPRPVGRRHPAWWTVVALVLGVLLFLFAVVLVYLRPLVVVYGWAAVAGPSVSISGHHPDTSSKVPYQAVTFPTSAGHNLTGNFQKLHFLNTHEIELIGVTVGSEGQAPFFVADAVRLSWNWKYVFRDHRLSDIEMDKPSLYLGKMLAAFPRSGEEDGDPSEAGGDPFDAMRHLFYRFTLSKATIWIDDLAPGMPTLPLTIGWHAPVVWVTGSLHKAPAQEESVKFADMNGIVLYSPTDGMTRVLDLGKIHIGFKWEGLARQEIESISITEPTVYIGPALFDFASSFKQGSGPAATATGVDAPPEAPAPEAAPADAQAAPPSAKKEWVLKNFALSKAHLQISAFSEPGLMLPFTFDSSAVNVNLSHLDKLSLQNRIVIPTQDYDYPAYGVKLKKFGGNIYFGLPPGSKMANNLNNKITIEEASWKDLAVKNAWSSVTFDKTGIYGNLGGEAYGGYINGDYAIHFDDGFPWHAGLYLTGAQTKDPVAKLAGPHFTLDGKMNADIEVDAMSREILKTTAGVKFPAGGRMEIASIDNLMDKLPADWAPWKKAIVDNVLGGFRDYRFDTGTFDAAYGTPTSHAQLTLEGAQGRRNFEVNWTREESTQNFVLPTQRPPQISIQATRTP